MNYATRKLNEEEQRKLTYWFGWDGYKKEKCTVEEFENNQKRYFIVISEEAFQKLELRTISNGRKFLKCIFNARNAEVYLKIE